MVYARVGDGTDEDVCKESAEGTSLTKGLARTKEETRTDSTGDLYAAVNASSAADRSPRTAILKHEV